MSMSRFKDFDIFKSYTNSIKTNLDGHQRMLRVRTFKFRYDILPRFPMADFVDLKTKGAFENHIEKAEGKCNKTAKAYTKAKVKKEEKRRKLTPRERAGLP